MACLSAGFEMPFVARRYPDAPQPVVLANSRDAAPAVLEKKPSSVYLSIISQQTFIGCWKLTSEVTICLAAWLSG